MIELNTRDCALVPGTGPLHTLTLRRRCRPTVRRLPGRRSLADDPVHSPRGGAGAFARRGLSQPIKQLQFRAVEDGRDVLGRDDEPSAGLAETDLRIELLDQVIADACTICVGGSAIAAFQNASILRSCSYAAGSLSLLCGAQNRTTGAPSNLGDARACDIHAIVSLTRFRSSIECRLPNFCREAFHAPNEEGVILYSSRRCGVSVLGGGRAFETGEQSTSLFHRRISIAELRVFQNQGRAHLPCQACWPHAMRRLPYDQQRATPFGAALAREHDLERRAVASELRAGPAGGCARLAGEPTAQTSARPRGRWRPPSWWRPAVQLAAGSGMVDIEGVCAGRSSEIGRE